MVSQRNSGRLSANGTHAKKRHARDARGTLWDMSFQPPPGLKAELDKPLLSRHKGYFIQVENKDKKEKKLEYLHTDLRRMAGMEFVPIGNPALTAKCKDISREEGAAIFIVSPAYRNIPDPEQLAVHTNRIGYQFRESIVERAREELGISKPVTLQTILPGAPEPIPDTQAEINEQADLAIKDLFPRIPNFDRRTVIDKAFNKATIRPGGKAPVGLAPEIPLSRRVQLAVLAHIRHIHTRYDRLLDDHGWAVARHTVRKLCLETLVKWRGDEENGRDQEDAILRELVIISDSESDDEDDEDDDEDSEDEGESSDTSERRRLSGDGMEWDSALSRTPAPPTHQTTAPLNTTQPLADASQGNTTQRPADTIPVQHRRTIRKAVRRAGKRRANRDRRGFERYQAAQAKWNETEERLRREASQQPHPVPAVAMNRSASHGSRPRLSTEAGPAPLQVQHASSSGFRSLDAQGSNRERERLTYGHAAQGAQIYHRQQEARFERDPCVGELGLIVGSQATHHPGASVERVRHQDQDLRDHLVKSIESPELPSFPSQPLGQPSWEQRRDVATYDRVPALGMPAGSRPLQHTSNYAAPPRDDFILVAPRSQANRAMVETRGYPQSTMPVTSQRGFGRIFTAPAATFTHGLHSSGHRENTTAVPDGSSHRPDYRVIAANDDDAPLRSRVRPIMVGETHGQTRRVTVDLTRDSPDPAQRQPTVLRSANQIRHPDSEYLVGHGHRTWNEGRIEQRPNDLSQGFVQIIRVSDRFPRPHEAQPVPSETGRYEIHPSTPRYREHHHGFDGAGSYEAYPQHAVQHGRVERVVARVEEPLHGYHYQPLPDGMRQPGGVPVNVHRQERVVGLEYVSAAPDRGIYSFATSPRMDTNEGGNWSRPASVLPTFQDQNQRPTPGQHYTREDGVIVLN